MTEEHLGNVSREEFATSFRDYQAFMAGQGGRVEPGKHIEAVVDGTEIRVRGNLDPAAMERILDAAQGMEYLSLIEKPGNKKFSEVRMATARCTPQGEVDPECVPGVRRPASSSPRCRRAVHTTVISPLVTKYRRRCRGSRHCD